MSSKPQTKCDKTTRKLRFNSMNSNSNSLRSSTESILDEKIRLDFYLIQSVSGLIDSFFNDSTDSWKLVSERMFNFGYKKLSDSQCKQLFNNCISRYVGVLETSKSFRNACHSYQSFAKLNTLDLKPFLNPKTYQKVMKLRESLDANRSAKKTVSLKKPHKQAIAQANFTNKANDNKHGAIDQSNTASISLKEDKNTVTTEGSEQVGNKNSFRAEKIRNKSKLDNGYSKFDNNIVITFKNDSKSGKERKVEYKPNTSLGLNQSHKKIELNANTSSDPQQNLQNDELIAEAIEKCNLDDTQSYSSQQNINISSDNRINYDKSFIGSPSDSELVQKVLELSEHLITRDFLISDPSIAWQIVSFHMVFKKDYKEFTTNQCQDRFNYLIKRYSDILKNAKSLQEARNQFHLFDIMSRIDLSLFMDPIIYQLIAKLKKKLGLNVEHRVPSNLPQINQKQSYVQQKISIDSVVNRTSPGSQLKPDPGKQVLKSDVNKKSAFYQRQKLRVDNDLFDLIKTETIDDSLIRDQVLKCSTISEQIECFRNYILLSKEDYEKRVKLKNKLQDILNGFHFNCILHFFGSTDNSVGFRNSDIDLFIELKHLNNSVDKVDYEIAIECLTEMKDAFRRYFKFFIPKPFASLRCPIIQIDFKYMSEKFRADKSLQEELQNFGISCDLSLSNALGPHNSRLIRLFCDIEPQFQDLAIILRYWAKINGFTDSKHNGFTSYAFTQLVVFFCQNLSPPLLPTIDHLRQLTNKSVIVDGWECSFCGDRHLIKKSENKQTVIELIAEFFRFYANFQFLTQVICPKTGLSQHKYNFNLENKTSVNNNNKNELCFKMTSLCCIQDPFNLEHNLTGNLSFPVFDRFLEYVKQIAINSDLIFYNSERDNDWGISKIITKFNPTDYPIAVHYHGTPSLRLVLKSAEISAQEIIKSMVNEFCDTTLILLRDVYRIHFQLTAKWDIIIEQICPFAQYSLKLEELDLQVIDYNNREVAKDKLNSEFQDMSDFDREKATTQKVIERFKDKKLSHTAIECRFVHFINARLSCPFIDFEIIDLKSSSKSVTSFLNRLFEFTTQVINKDYYRR